MARPITLFTGQWADLPFEEVARLARKAGLEVERTETFRFTLLRPLDVKPAVRGPD